MLIDTAVDVEVPEVPIETKPTRTRKRTNKSSTDTPARKRGRQQTAAQAENDSHSNTALSQTSSDMSSPPLTTEGERPDVNMCLKVSFVLWLLFARIYYILITDFSRSSPLELERGNNGC